MSATTELDPWRALHSHMVNCSKGCTRKKVACAVGRILLARALAAPDKGHKPRSFPFVAKQGERILYNSDGQWIEAVVRDRSLSARQMYQPQNWETGKLGAWRTAQSAIVGYEVETDAQERHYARPYQIRSLRKPKGEVASTPQRRAYDKGITTPVTGFQGDLIIIRRSN